MKMGFIFKISASGWHMLVLKLYLSVHIFFSSICILIANLKFLDIEEGLKLISAPNIKIILHNDGFPSLGEGYEVMKT